MRSRRTIVVFIIAVALIGAGVFAYLRLTAREPGDVQLDKTAAAFAAVQGFVVDGTHTLTSTGPGVPPDGTIPFKLTYTAPDGVLMEVSYPLRSPSGELVPARFVSLTRGDAFYIERLDDDAAWHEAQSPLVEGFDLAGVKTLPTFLRNATAPTFDDKTTLEGKPVILVTGTGSAADWTGVIYHDYAEQTEPAVPFRIWIDPKTDLPIRIETSPVQLPVEPGQHLGHTIVLDFGAYGPQTLPAPSPLLPEPTAPVKATPGPGEPTPTPMLTPDPSGNLPDITPSPDQTPAS